MSGPRMLGIAGTGLMGGSVGLAARALGWHVLGYDADETALAQALEVEAIDEAADRSVLYACCDVVVLAMHVRGIVSELETIDRGSISKPSLVVDVGSVKAPVVQAARGLTNFVATHPMAGAERSGAKAAAAALFAGKTWAYVPSGSGALDAAATRFIQSLGARPVAIGAQEHDAAVALTSHLPQVLATLFAARLRTVAEGGPFIDGLCGPAARELIRLSRSSEAMWDDILHANREAVSAELHAFAATLRSRAESIERL